MNKKYIFPFIFLIALLSGGCFKDIDTEPLPLPEVEDYFIVESSIKQNQTFYRFYESAVLELSTSKNTKWDLAFESAGDGGRVLLGWATFSTALPSGYFNMDEITIQQFEELIEDKSLDTGKFDDPTFLNTVDSLALTNHWENGEVWYVDRHTSDDRYYVIQYVSADQESYTFKYASAQALSEVIETTIFRASAFNYVYYSFETQKALTIEPDYREWDIMFTPYRGWWETDNPGIYSPFNMSGIMINNEAGGVEVRVAQIFDPEVTFEELEFASIYEYEFTDKKGVIGADWKLLGDPNSGKIFSVDRDKKYLLKKSIPESGEVMYFKLRIIDYYYPEKDSPYYEEPHYPTVEFKYLGSE